MNFEELFIRIFILLTVRLPGMSSRSNLHRYQGYIAPIHPSTSPPSTPPPSAPSPAISSSPPRSTGSPSKLVFRSHYPGFNFDHEESGKSTEAGGRSTFDLSNPNGGRSTYDLSFPDGGRSTSEFSLQDGGRSTSDLSVQALRGARSRVSRDGFEKGVRMLEKPESRKPRFDPRVENNLTVVLGQTAQLQCRVFNLGNKTVSWLRHDSMHILSAGTYTYISNNRFFARYIDADDTWVLIIREVRLEDAGKYECQVSSLPVISNFIFLDVVEPSARILGDEDLYVQAGSTLNITCVIQHLRDDTDAIRWIHQDKELNYNTEDRDVSVFTSKGDVSTSTLIIHSLAKSDSGRYICSPEGIQPSTIVLHVLKGEITSQLHIEDGRSLIIPIVSLVITTTILLLLGSVKYILRLRSRAVSLND